MAKSRVNLKGVKKAADRLKKDLRSLQSRPAQARRTEAAALHKQLTAIRTLIDKCPDGLFRLIEVAEPAARRRKVPKKTARKTTRKGTRKGR